MQCSGCSAAHQTPRAFWATHAASGVLVVVRVVFLAVSCRPAVQPHLAPILPLNNPFRLRLAARTHCRSQTIKEHALWGEVRVFRELHLRGQLPLQEGAVFVAAFLGGRGVWEVVDERGGYGGSTSCSPCSIYYSTSVPSSHPSDPLLACLLVHRHAARAAAPAPAAAASAATAAPAVASALARWGAASPINVGRQSCGNSALSVAASAAGGPHRPSESPQLTVPACLSCCLLCLQTSASCCGGKK